MTLTVEFIAEKLMELFVIKSGNDYIRVVNDQYTLCGIDKASVFPPDKLENVKAHLKKIQERNFANVSISKLKIEEEPIDKTSI